MKPLPARFSFNPDGPHWLILAKSILLGFGLAITAMEGWEAATRWLAYDLSRAWR